MRRLYKYRRSLVLAAAAALLVLALCATALAAHPKAGKTYSGHTSAAPINGFSAPISFKVSSNGKKLLGLQYGNAGCFVFPIMGNPYKSGLDNVGTLTVSTGGGFSVKNVAFTTVHTKAQLRQTLTSTVTGTFKTATSATGTITYTEKQVAPGLNHTCGPDKVTFTATAK